MRALIDANVLMDYLLNRAEFANPAEAIWKANRDGTFTGYIAAITVNNFYYVARKQQGSALARQGVGELLSLWRICPVGVEALNAAQNLPIVDFEDAIQCACALEQQLDALVTRNVGDYRAAPVRVLTPGEFLAKLGA